MELFTTQMRKSTRKIHSVSDTLVNAKFAISLTDETVWGAGIFVFYHIFGFLEDARERLNIPDLNYIFIHRSLFRKKAFEEDLNHYLGLNWQSVPKSAALEQYLEHLQNLEKDNPKLLLAYVYHLYLGLLSGGQILAKKRKLLGNVNKNKNVYIDKVTNFGDVDISKLKKDFKDAMNEIAEDMTEEEKLVFLEESNQVFIMNNLIVHSVGGQTQAIQNIMCKISVAVLFVIGIFCAYKWYK